MLNEVYTKSVPTCDVCEAPATTSYIYIDDEGATYTTERCDEHPETDLEYKEREL